MQLKIQFFINFKMNPSCVFNVLCVIGVLTIFSCYNTVFCEVLEHQPCSFAPSNSCEILSISLDPCPEAVENETCNLHRGTNITWTFNYLPHFSGNNITFRVFTHTLMLDIPYYGLNPNACVYTKCPFIAGEKRTLTYGSYIQLYYPPGEFMVKWTVSNEKNEECCVMAPIRIV